VSEINEYLYRIQPTRPEMLSAGPTADEERIIGEHFDYLKALAAKRIVVLAGRTLNTDPSSFGIVICFPTGSPCWPARDPSPTARWRWAAPAGLRHRRPRGGCRG
jgi:hypothetical protein